MRGAPLFSGLVLLAACSDVLIVPDDGTSSSTSGAGAGTSTGTGTNTGAGDSSGGGGAGGGAVGPHRIEIAVATESDQGLLVLLNEPDGTLVASWSGDELPVSPTVADGQTVSFAYVIEDGTEYIETRRVTPEVTRIEHQGWHTYDFPCAMPSMQVVVDVPATGSSNVADAHLNTGAHGHVQSLPGVMEMTAASCFGAVSKVDVLVTVGDFSYDAFELIQDVPFVVGATVELTPTFASQTRSVMTVQVDDMGDATSAGGTISWRSDAEHTFPFGGLVAFEKDLEVFHLGNAPFTYAPNAVDLPHGHQEARIRVTFPPSDAACDRKSHLTRTGRSAEAIAFHANALAEPTLNGDSWMLGEGEVGQTLWRYAYDDAVHWSSFEDPAWPPLPMVFPQFPDELPEGFEVPAVPPAPKGIQHWRSTGVASYAEEAASVHEPIPATLERRVSNLACP
jgi:hypothetical protein